MFASAFDDLVYGLPDGWRTATYDIRVEDALDPGSDNIGAAGAADVLATCRAQRRPGDNAFRFRVSHDTSGVPVSLAELAMRELDGTGCAASCSSSASRRARRPRFRPGSALTTFVVSRTVGWSRSRRPTAARRSAPPDRCRA